MVLLGSSTHRVLWRGKLVRFYGQLLSTPAEYYRSTQSQIASGWPPPAQPIISVLLPAASSLLGAFLCVGHPFVWQLDFSIDAVRIYKY